MWSTDTAIDIQRRRYWKGAGVWWAKHGSRNDTRGLMRVGSRYGGHYKVRGITNDCSPEEVEGRWKMKWLARIEGYGSAWRGVAELSLWMFWETGTETRWSGMSVIEGRGWSAESRGPGKELCYVMDFI